MVALPAEVRRRYDTSSLRFIMAGAAPLSTEVARRFEDAFGPILPLTGERPVLFGLAQTARIDDPATPPAQTRSAKIRIRAGHHAPESDSNHTDLPLGTDLAAGRPKRTRYVVA